jgi:hypothetical protein
MNINDYSLNYIGNYSNKNNINMSYIIEKNKNKINNLNEKKLFILIEILQNIKGKDLITMKGFLDKTKSIILKIENFNNGKKEFDIQKKLKSYKGFIKYYHYTTCNVKNIFYNTNQGNIISNNTNICNRNGNNNWINIIPYYQNGSFEHYLQNNSNERNNIYNIIYKVIQNYINVYLKIKFNHNDFEPKNIVLDKNLNPFIIDFENSNFQGNLLYFWRDLENFFFIIQRYLIDIDFNDFIRNNIILNNAYQNEPTQDIMNLFFNNLKDLW